MYVLQQNWPRGGLQGLLLEWDLAESVEVPLDARQAAPVHRLRHSQIITLKLSLFEIIEAYLFSLFSTAVSRSFVVFSIWTIIRMC